TGMSIPISLAFAMMLGPSLGMNINAMTLFAAIVILGMLVDDAIVVVENVARHREMGMPPGEAVIRGASEVAKPITAAVFTTMAALLPMSLMSGTMGKFMAEIPKPGIYALAASLVEALITLPPHLYVTSRWGRPRFLNWPLKKWDKVRRVGDSIMKWLRNKHNRMLRKTLRHRYVFVVCIAVVFVATLFAAKHALRFELVATTDAPLFLIEVKAPAGTSLDELEKIIIDIENAVFKLPEHEIKSVSATLGIRIDEKFGGAEYGKELAQVMVELNDPKFRPRNADPIIDDLRPLLSAVKGADIVIADMQGGPPVGAAINVRISGEDFRVIENIADEIKTFIAQMPGTTDIDDNLREGNREIVIRPTPDAAALAGSHPRAIATEVRAAVDGIEAVSVRIGDDDVVLRVRYPENRRVREIDLHAVRIPTAQGSTPISNLADISPGRGWSSIKHYNGRRTVSVSADVNRGGVESGFANASIMEEFEARVTGMGGLLELGGENADTEESLESIKGAGILCISLIAIILVFQFGNFGQPIAVLSALPLAMIGIVITLIVHSQLFELTGIGLDLPMGLMPLIGMTALLGVIVNDSIVLVDFINQSRLRGGGRWRSILQAGRHRIRPVILTSITTAAGILPMGYTLRGTSSFLAPMAIAFGWGLLFGTGLTLLVVPTLSAVIDDIRIRLFGGYHYSED
ncbi:MAG: efflux RND transporter permease subunit, partial [Candidatus Lindowbacteria bacterium]|nr:efflux RND transporter permease subunit [Candidatus Lindowbacteria bacterium]